MADFLLPSALMLVDIVINLRTKAEELGDTLYRQRGESENRIKEAQLDLFGTRASCHEFLANPLLLLLAASVKKFD